MVRWTLKRGADRRFREGHPWIFSNELSASPKGILPGETVELFDSQGQFLARGYGHPNSLIAFREMTRDERVTNPFDREFLVQSLEKSTALRNRLGFSEVSYRLCFGEADGFPGLIIDRYRGLKSQAYVIQAQTSGMDRNIICFVGALEELVKRQENENGLGWKDTAIILKNDSKMRQLEGLEIQDCRVEKPVEGVDFRDFEILVRSAGRLTPVRFQTDLVDGQKTGFFLDQSTNVERVVGMLKDAKFFDKSKIRVLDICCYVGQWSAQISAACQAAGVEAQCTLFDTSETALKFASRNVEKAGGIASIVQGDALKDLAQLAPQSFDVVICDPPAFIKGKKDLGPGQHAYMKLNDAAMRLSVPGGVFVSCSCSGLLTESDFQQILAKGARRSQRQVRWVTRGSQGSDHPVSLNFPEGSYLKGWFGVTIV